jgi:hypothetical protein
LLKVALKTYLLIIIKLMESVEWKEIGDCGSKKYKNINKGVSMLGCTPDADTVGAWGRKQAKLTL